MEIHLFDNKRINVHQMVDLFVSLLSIYPNRASSTRHNPIFDLLNKQPEKKKKRTVEDAGEIRAQPEKSTWI